MSATTCVRITDLAGWEREQFALPIVEWEYDPNHNHGLASPFEHPNYLSKAPARLTFGSSCTASAPT